jgi:hypothetical protein
MMIIKTEYICSKKLYFIMAIRDLIPCGTALVGKYHMLSLSSKVQYIKFYKYMFDFY